MNIKPVIKEASLDTLLKSVANGKSSGFCIVKLYDQMNYYSSQYPGNMKADGDFYGYGIG